MITLTNDMYAAISLLGKWYRKAQHQVIDIAGGAGTGVWQCVQEFIDNFGIDRREIVYLSYDQKQVVEMAAKRYHTYYLDGIIYKYTRMVDFNSLYVINPHSNETKFRWVKDVRKKIDPKYRLIVVMDGSLMNEKTLYDLCTFGLPIILMRDPYLIPAPDSFVYTRDPNIMLRELQPDLIRNPITYFANKVISGEKITPGNYDVVSVVTKKQMNLYNLKSSDMTVTCSEQVRNELNRIYRERVLQLRSPQQVVGERLIVMSNHYNEKLVNEDEKKIKIYLTKGLVGYISRCNRHADKTRYVPFDFKPEFYHESFTELYMDRNYLNGDNTPSRQIIPDDVVNVEYAYALSAMSARLSHWDKVTMVADPVPELNEDLQKYVMYTAITRAKKALTIVL